MSKRRRKTGDADTLTATEIADARRTQARVLDLSGRQISRLPEDIGQLSTLEELNLSATGISRLPYSFVQLSKLKTLDLSNNPFSQWPSGVGGCRALEELNLENCHLRTLPDDIGRLRRLTSLNLSHNRLTELPASIGELRALEVLNLSDNRLQNLPASLQSLTRLHALILALNGFQEIPPPVRSNAGLVILSIAGNPIGEVPEWIAELRALECLDLSATEYTVTALGEEWGLVRRLDVPRGKLESLPQSMRSMTGLRRLYLHGHVGLGLPPEVLGSTWAEEIESGPKTSTAVPPAQVLDYYFRTRLDRQPLNEAKLILVGRGTVGKTSIVNRLVRNQFKIDERKTDGIQITDWNVRLPDRTDVRLNIWDFGGQEIMHATHQFFLTQRSLYMLVLNGREGGEDADADYWLRLIDSFAAESPVIVVLNKIKEHPFDVNRRGLQQKYPFVKEFVKTDCEDGTGVDALLKVIQRETDALEHLRDAFPASWFSIKDRLATSGRNFLNYDEYRRVCHELGEADPGAQDALAFYLHSLGIALNYRDDPRLQDTHVLNPHWVTNGIYKILNSELLAQRGGIVGLADLAAMLPPVEYPARMHRFLFDLMRKFDLCFSFSGDDSQYLIPELLDKQEPVESAAFDPVACLNFQYHYPVLPEGLLPRFIVRTHALSEGLPRWRTGVILKFERNRALVKADVQGKTVSISVDGPAVSRRRLLAVIRAEFETIHRAIKNLQPLEMVPLPKHPDVMVSYRELTVIEQTGERHFPKVVNDYVIQLDVRELLDGVDLVDAKARQKASGASRPVRLFFSYSHKDEPFRNELETHLKLLQRQQLIHSWHDRRIDAGEEWREKIDENLDAADVILLLVSADFIASDYCYEKELARALERHAQQQAVVVPVVVRDVNLKGAPFEHLQALPKDALAVAKWPDRDSAWRNVAEGIERVVSRLQGSA